jgi:5-methylthioadenosine/S-adenosylhomocysteine deaminase
MQSVDQIIHAKWLITCEHPGITLENHALIVKDGLIKDILPSQAVSNKYQASSEEHFDHHAIFPGLINAHTHLAMNYFRGLADDLALMDWLNHHIWPAEKKWVSHEFVYDASLFAIAEMIRCGTTCFNDMYFFPEATAKAAEIAGVRGHVGMTVIDFPTAWAKDTEEYFAKGLEFYEQYKNHPLVTPTLAPHAIYTVAEKNLLKVKDIAERYNLRINMHIHETADEINQSLAQTKKRPLQRLKDIGFVSPRLIAVHMAQLTQEDLAVIQADKPQIVHCPQSNMKLASGTYPIETLQALGLNVGLGTDGAASNNDLNMLGEMRTAAFLAKLETGNPQSLPAEKALQLATINGARVLGIDNIAGSLHPGKSADFAAINLDEVETLPLYHPISQIVYAASRQQVTDVWVKGKRLLNKRKLTTLDEQELKKKATYWSEKIRV